jgi:hypothetical protein
LSGDGDGRLFKYCRSDRTRGRSLDGKDVVGIIRSIGRTR